MKINLLEATFIIPVRIESPDRLRNVVTSIAFLLVNLKNEQMIKERIKVVSHSMTIQHLLVFEI